MITDYNMQKLTPAYLPPCMLKESPEIESG